MGTKRGKCLTCGEPYTLTALALSKACEHDPFEYPTGAGAAFADDSTHDPARDGWVGKDGRP